MKQEPEHNIADIIRAAGGRLVSRIRLQKIAYILDRLGAESGFKYSYHHYGPYSRELDSAIVDAEAFNLVVESFDRRISDGARYSIFETSDGQKDRDYSYLKNKELQSLVKKLASTNVTVLELAATANWIAAVEEIADWEVEIKRRKGSKTDKGRLEEAIKLLVAIGLPPATTSQ